MPHKWARDYFDTARAEALKLRAIDEDMARRHAKLMLQAQKYAESRVSGFDSQSAIDDYIDAEMAAEAARTPHRAFVDDATELLYGPHARAGVAKLYGSKNADVVNMHWLQLLPWTSVARETGYSTRWVKQLAVNVFDWMDEVGESHIRAYNDGEEEFFESMKWSHDG